VDQGFLQAEVVGWASGSPASAGELQPKGRGSQTASGPRAGLKFRFLMQSRTWKSCGSLRDLTLNGQGKDANQRGALPYFHIGFYHAWLQGFRSQT
jgi:hypothetical protein